MVTCVAIGGIAMPPNNNCDWRLAATVLLSLESGQDSGSQMKISK